MKKTWTYLKLALIALLNGFFVWHIFEGKLGLIAQKTYKKNTIHLLEKQTLLLSLQQKLKNEISYLQSPINMDYIECYALKHWYKVPKNAKIIKLEDNI